jgi:hypothetical protein
LEATVSFAFEWNFGTENEAVACRLFITIEYAALKIMSQSPCENKITIKRSTRREEQYILRRIIVLLRSDDGACKWDINDVMSSRSQRFNLANTLMYVHAGSRIFSLEREIHAKSYFVCSTYSGGPIRRLNSVAARRSQCFRVAQNYVQRT